MSIGRNNVAVADAVERTRAQYDALAGALYDFGVERPAIARLGALAMWSADVRVFYAPMDELREPTAGMTILDVPCGGGVALRKLARDRGVRYLAVDYSARMHARARTLAAGLGLEGIEFVRADVGALPFEDASVDLCISSAGLHCFPDPALAVRELARCLRPGGRLVGSMAVRGTGRRHDALIALFGRLGVFGPSGTEADLGRWMRDAGLSEIEIVRSGALVHFGARR